MLLVRKKVYTGLLPIEEVLEKAEEILRNRIVTEMSILLDQITFEELVDPEDVDFPDTVKEIVRKLKEISSSIPNFRIRKIEFCGTTVTFIAEYES